MSRMFKRGYLALMLLFLYVPILVLIVQSFNAGVSRAKWQGFSLKWYIDLFNSASIMNAFYITVTIALLAALFATILGTLAAIGIHAMQKRPQGIMMTLTNIPMTMPDIVTGIHRQYFAAGADIKERAGAEIRGSHPLHGSKSGKNFAVNTSKNCWHCFRHKSGGGPLEWIAVMKGIISCSEARPGCLR